MAKFKNFYDQPKKKNIPIKIHEDTLVDLHPQFFRDGTDSKKIRVGFVLTKGGIGDFICWYVALDYIATYHKHVIGTVYAPKHVLEMTKYFFEDRNGSWRVVDRECFNDKLVLSQVNYIPRPDLFLNGCGSSLVDLGFAYFANRNKAPSWHQNYLEFNFDKVELLEVKNKLALPDKMIVLTPGVTDKNRGFLPEYFNKLKDYVIELGYTPVFLGKRVISNHLGKDRMATISEEYDFSGGIDLTDETSLIEAAMIIELSSCIAGVDNGLLHLAGMTTTPIVFGHTVMEPEMRAPKRRAGRVFDIVPSHEDLPCRFCMTNMRYFFNIDVKRQKIYGHDFKNCIYKDYKCLNVIGKDDCKAWKDAIYTAVNVQ